MIQEIYAEVITIGDEILYGQITDTNTQWISAELDKIGVKTIRKSSVGDREDRILEILREAASRAHIILMTGGLGPTKDDITKKTLARYFDVELVMNEEALRDVSDFFVRRGVPLTDLNRLQAVLPANATFISNKVGTAPGMWFEQNGKVYISMPGVPHEMKWLMENAMIPKLKQHFNTPIIYHKLIRTVGIGESFLAAKIEPWEDNLPAHIRLAYLPSLGQVKLRLTATGENLLTLQGEVEAQIAGLQKLVPEHIYGYDGEELEDAVGKMLQERNLTLAVAESCTGGFIAHTITRVPGSSKYFMGGIVAYSNEIKINQLGVNRETIEKHGAVSEETVREMAEQVRTRLGASLGVAITGIAGPDGGTPEKPVGTVWIAFANGVQTITKKLQLFRDRDVNIKFTAIGALNLIRQHLQ